MNILIKSINHRHLWRWFSIVILSATLICPLQSYAGNNGQFKLTYIMPKKEVYRDIVHALIDIYNLPIVSNEETAADNLAAILALEYTNDGYDIVMDSAELFDILDQTKTVYAEDELWDEHALDSQRFYNILCLTYGRDPEKVLAELKKLKNKKLLTFIHKKGNYCEEEYARQVHAWLLLLEPHLIKN